VNNSPFGDRGYIALQFYSERMNLRFRTQSNASCAGDLKLADVSRAKGLNSNETGAWNNKVV
jgi:hypothetical protein